MPAMTRGRAPIGLIAAAAMLASHWIAYFIAAPDPHQRSFLLQATGHSYWPFATSFMVGAAILGLGSFVGQRLSPATRGSRQSLFAHALPRFVTLQVGGFVSLEVVERLLTEHTLGFSTFTERTMLIGLAIQLITSFLAALLLVAIAFVVEQLAGVTPSFMGQSSLPVTLTSLVARTCLVPATGARTLRGPPVLV
jgi:hypothetical protein